jgi:MoaA/NifB/PqqE/SkfB family radical SAM enzyme
MVNNINERQERVRILKEEILDSVNKRAAENVAALSVREKSLLLNDFEYNIGKIHLGSTPEGVGIGAHYNCNAKCIFCLEGKPKLFSLERYREFFEPRLSRIISKARYVNFCGFGELLLMPDIEKFLDHVNGGIPEVNKIYTTNGTPLLNKEVLIRLTKSKIALEISLHASNGKLHRVLTRLNIFEQITSGIKQLIASRKHRECPHVVLVFIVNTLNIEDLPNFIKFAAELGVDEVACNYMSIFHHSHLKLSCFFKQEISTDSFKEAEEVAHKVKMPLRLPPRFGLSGQAAVLKNICSDPWKYFYVENESSVLPCCFAGDHVGYLDEVDFETIWNGFYYKNLRSCLSSQNPGEWCRYCYKYRSENVNDIRAHINFRPGFRDKILKGYKS